jgi:competence CoiA-like predicted nuclease
MKTTVEAPRKKNSMKYVSVMGIQKHIAQDRILVSNAEANTIQPSVKRIQTLQQNAPYAEEITRPTIKAATYIKTYKEEETKQQFNRGETLLNHITQALTSTATTSLLP